MAVMQNWERKNQKLVREIIDTFNPTQKTPANPSIFHELLASNLPPHEKSYERLWQEGAALMGAAIETTSNTLNVALFHLSQNPEKLTLLKQELEQIMPYQNELVPWAKIETLPYLTAVIKESLRLAHGTSLRFIRVAPLQTLQYKHYSLPPGTAVSMSAMLLCENVALFPNPKTCCPERWLEKNTNADLFVFGRGTRMCAGMK